MIATPRITAFFSRAGAARNPAATVTFHLARGVVFASLVTSIHIKVE